MDRYNKANGVDAVPAAPAAADHPYYTSGDPQNDIPATTPGPWWFHMITESMRNVIVAAGLVPSYADLTLFLQAVQQMATIVDATTLVKGKVQLATAAEVTTGTNAAKVVTPATQGSHKTAAKAWVLFGTTGAILASYNVSSVTKNGTGDFTVNFSNNMNSVNYAYALACKDAANFGTLPLTICQHYNIAPTVSAFRLMCKGTSSGNAGDTIISAEFFGD